MTLVTCSWIGWKGLLIPYGDIRESFGPSKLPSYTVRIETFLACNSGLRLRHPGQIRLEENCKSVNNLSLGGGDEVLRNRQLGEVEARLANEAGWQGWTGGRVRNERFSSRLNILRNIQ